MARWIEVQAPINIAIIKYWGKRDEDLILPLNDSISLSINALCARTRVEVVEDGGGKDTVSINGHAVRDIRISRFAKCFLEVRQLLTERRADANGVSFRVESTTNFPVAAGLASSAAGFAAIAFALGNLFDLTRTEISQIARIGSGSACRSVGEGLMQWHCGQNPTGWDCYSESIFPQSHWPELRAIILILNEKEKETASTVGMRNTVATSELLKYRVDYILPQRIERLIEAFERRDFDEFAKITIADSNQFHAVCLDTFPPLMYLTEVSREVIRQVHKFNEDRLRAAYTFDAGPNACIYLCIEDVKPFLELVASTFRTSPRATEELQSLGVAASSNGGPVIEGLIVSEVGMGPEVLRRS